MAISEKKVFPLNIDKCEAFIPKKEKDNFKKQKLELDLTLIEEDDQFLKLKDTPRRKSSTGSTSISKPEDQSELLSVPNSPVESPQVGQQKGIFFGRVNNYRNNVFNYYQNTEEYLKENYAQLFKCKNSKNYLLKSELSSKKFNFENNNKNNIKQSNKETLKQNNNFNNIKINNPMTLKGSFTPKMCNLGGKGKFDLPMYYIFYGWDCKHNINNF